MDRLRLSDEQWAVIQPLIPPHGRTGRPRVDDRRTLEGILFVRITGCRWQDLPRDYGAPTTVWRRWKEWKQQGAWDRIWRAFVSTLEILELAAPLALAAVGAPSHW